MDGVVRWREEIVRKLIGFCLDLLDEEDIRIIFFDQILDFSFFFDSADTVHVPGDDVHNANEVRG